MFGHRSLSDCTIHVCIYVCIYMYAQQRIFRDRMCQQLFPLCVMTCHILCQVLICCKVWVLKGESATVLYFDNKHQEVWCSKHNIPIRSLLRNSNILTLVCCWFAKVYTNVCKKSRPDDNTICALRCNIKHRVNASHHVHFSCSIHARRIHIPKIQILHAMAFTNYGQLAQEVSNVDIRQVQPTQQRMMTRGRVQTQSQTVHQPNFNWLLQMCFSLVWDLSQLGLPCPKVVSWSKLHV